MADIDNLTWRRGTADDSPLLFAVFSADKAAEFAPLGLSDQQLQPLLEMQFRARQLSYGQNCPNALDTILCLEDGTPVGRHLIDRQPTRYRSVDLAVLPEYRGRGIGAWALRQIQQLAQVEGVGMSLRVIQTNAAVRLYERLGFQKISSDEISFEMEWLPTRPHTVISTGAPQGRSGEIPVFASGSAAAAPGMRPEDRIVLSSGEELARSQVLDTIFAFLREIGLTVHLGSVPESFLPGIQLVSGGLKVDIETLLYPGDLLHEAGHLAVMPPDRRHSEVPASTTDGAEEMAAIAWSYAAALHIGLPPEVVFHEHGYRGQSQSLIHRYADACPPGLPILWWIGLTTQPKDGVPSIYPRMIHWLRTIPAEPPGATHLDSELREELNEPGAPFMTVLSS